MGGIEHGEDQTSLGQALGPVLRDVCGGRLGAINWFRTTWQHGGAATGFSTWQQDGREPIPCVVKAPVGYSEYFWTKRLGLRSVAEWDSDESLMLPTPRVLAAGFELGGYDLAWLVMERMAQPKADAWDEAGAVNAVFAAAAEFHAAAVTERAVEPDEVVPTPDWGETLDKSLRAVHDHDLEDAGAWTRGIEAVVRGLDGLARAWDERPIDTWCHLDLHTRNALRRVTPGAGTPGRVVLIDLAMVRAGSWIEDALYYERLHWGHESLLCGVEPLASLAAARSFIGLPTGEHEGLAEVRRALAAACAPAFIRTEGDGDYLRAALATLGRATASIGL